MTANPDKLMEAKIFSLLLNAKDFDDATSKMLVLVKREVAKARKQPNPQKGE